MRESFAEALRAELSAVVARYEALVRAHSEALAAAGGRESDGLRAEIASLKAENAALKAENDRLRAAADAALAEARAIEDTFAPERKFVEACAGIDGSLLLEAVRAAFGKDLAPTPSVYAALKGRGLDALLTQVIKERGRSAVNAPLLPREERALASLASAAGCELIIPATGTRFSVSTMDKASTVSEPAEEGNVVDCLIPGVRLAGTEGALVFPRVVVASG